MPAPGERLGAGSGQAGPPLSREVGNFTVAGVATRVTTRPPADADWGSTPPPDGTIVFEADGLLWVRLGGAWKSAVIF